MLDQEQAAFDERNSQLEQAKRLQKVEEQKNREMAQNQAALKAKLEYIEGNYDLSSNLKGINVETLRQVMQTNSQVNNTVTELMGKVDIVKTDTRNFEALRFA